MVDYTVTPAALIHQSLLRMKWVIVAGAVLGALSGILFLQFTERSFRIEAVVVPAIQDESTINPTGLGGALGGLGAIAGIGVGENRRFGEAKALMSTRGFVESFITDGDLLPILYSEDWDDENQQWRSEDATPSLWRAYEKFSSEVLSIVDDASMGVTYVRITWTDPDLAALWANALVDRVNKIVRDNEILEAKKSLDFLTEELPKTDSLEVRQGIYRLMDKQVNRVMLANVRPEFALRVLDKATSKSESDYDFPRPLFTLVAGTVFGVFLVVFYVLISVFLSPISSSSSRTQA